MREDRFAGSYLAAVDRADTARWRSEARDAAFKRITAAKAKGEKPAREDLQLFTDLEIIQNNLSGEP